MTLDKITTIKFWSLLTSLLFYTLLPQMTFTQETGKRFNSGVSLGYSVFNADWNMINFGLNSNYLMSSGRFKLYSNLSFSNGAKEDYTDFYDMTGIPPGYVAPQSGVPYPYFGFVPGLVVDDQDYLDLPTKTGTINILQLGLGLAYQMNLGSEWHLSPKIGLNYLYINEIKLIDGIEADVELFFAGSGARTETLIVIPFYHKRWTIAPDFGLELTKKVGPKGEISLSASYLNDFINHRLFSLNCGYALYLF